MRFLVFFCFVLLALIGCNSSNPYPEYGEEFNYTFYDKTIKDSIHSIQVGRSSLDQYGVIGYTALKHELVDETPALIKIKGTIVSIDNQLQTLTFIVHDGTDTITAISPFKTIKPEAFKNRPVILSGLFQLHPIIKFELDSYLVLGIKKAPAKN